MASQPQNRSSNLAHFARKGVFVPDAAEVAFDVLLALGYTEEVCANPLLPYATARRLMAAKKKLPASAAASLAQHPWEPHEALELIGFESRKSVLVNLVHSTVLDDEGLDALLTHKEIDGMLAEAVLHSQPLSDQYRTRFSRHGDFGRKLRQLSADVACDQTYATLVAALLTADDHGRGAQGGLSKLLQDVVHTHPRLLALLDDDTVTVPRRLCSAFASSVHLVDVSRQRKLAGLDSEEPRHADDLWLLMVLAGNPLVGKGVLDELTVSLAARPVPHERASDLGRNVTRRLDGERWLEPGTTLETTPTDKLPWVLRRALPSNYQDGRLYEMISLSSNENLSEADAAKLADALYSEVADTRAAEALTALTARFPALKKQMPEAVEDEPTPQEHLQASRTRKAALIERDSMLSYPEEGRRAWLTNEVSRSDGWYDWAAPVGLLACERLGSDRQMWEALLTLMPDFTGTFGELLDSAAML
jgi:hypothetical protein